MQHTNIYKKHLEKYYYSRLKPQKMDDKKLEIEIRNYLIVTTDFTKMVKLSTSKSDRETLYLLNKKCKKFNEEIKNLLKSEQAINEMFTSG